MVQENKRFSYKGIVVVKILFLIMTLEDNTEIVHSEMLPDNRVKVYVEKPDAKVCFHDMTCYLPSYEIESVNGFFNEEVAEYLGIINSVSHLIIKNTN